MLMHYVDAILYHQQNNITPPKMQYHTDTTLAVFNVSLFNLDFQPDPIPYIIYGGGANRRGVGLEITVGGGRCNFRMEVSGQVVADFHQPPPMSSTDLDHCGFIPYKKGTLVAARSPPGRLTKAPPFSSCTPPYFRPM